MTKKALITKAQLLKMANIAKKYGVVVEQEENGIKVRVAPFHGAEPAHSRDHSRDSVLDAPPEPIQPRFDHREHFVMERLSELRVGAKVHMCTLRGIAPSTQKKLLAPGYITVHHGKRGKLIDDEISLTRRGLGDWKALMHNRSKYWSL